MIRTVLSLFALLALAGRLVGQTPVPVYDHVVIVIEENKSPGEVIGNLAAPYINQVLVSEGANLTRMYAEEHESEGNYFWLFSGSNQGVEFTNKIPSWWRSKNYPFYVSNLAQQLIEKSLTFRGFAEGLPETGSTVTKSGQYARKHVPWISFGNIPQGGDTSISTNLPFEKFPSDFSRLPTVAIVVPDLSHDMHNPEDHPEIAVRNGDSWLRKNIDPYYQWAKSHNSLLILTFDESSNPAGHLGLSDPGSKNAELQNRIPTVFAGAHVRHGDFAEGKGVTHVNILRTIEAMYTLWASGGQSPNALKCGITSEYFIQDIFGK